MSGLEHMLQRWLAYANLGVAGGALVALGLTLYLLFHRSASQSRALPVGEPAPGSTGLRNTRTEVPWRHIC